MKACMMLAAGMLGALWPAAAAADPSLSPKFRAEAQLELLPQGSVNFGTGSSSTSIDAALAYGVTAMADYAVTPFLDIGVAPRFVFHVRFSAAPIDSDGEELDLRAHIRAHLPAGHGVELYAALSPGYAHVFDGPFGDLDGFALAGALGATYPLSPEVFLSAEIGYQRVFSSADVTFVVAQMAFSLHDDVDLSYLHLGLGLGTRF